MLNETDFLDVNDTSMDDLKQLVNNIINMPLSENIENHVEELKWSIDKTKDKIKENISISNNTKKEIKKLFEENIDGFDCIKESIKDHSKLITNYINERIKCLENILDESNCENKELTKLFKENIEKELEDLRNELRTILLNVDEKYDFIRSFLADQSKENEKKYEIIYKIINEGSDECKKISLQFEAQCRENSKLNKGLIVLGVINFILVSILIYFNILI